MRRAFTIVLTWALALGFVASAHALILLQDNFDDGVLDGWTQIENFRGNIVGDWSAQDIDPGLNYDGAMQFAWPPQSDEFGYIKADNLILPESYTLQFDARMVEYNSGQGADHILWFLNFVDHGNFVEGNLRQNPNNDLLLSEKIGGSYLFLYGIPFDTDESLWHQFCAVKDGSTVSFYFDSVPMYEYDIPVPISGGTLVLGASDGVYQFDNVLITTPQPIPEPSTLLLLGSASLFGAAWRKRLKK